MRHDLQHNLQNRTFGAKDCIPHLNFHGRLSASFLMRKFQITADLAIKILHSIIGEYENVVWVGVNTIAIEGGEYDKALPSVSPPRKRKPKPKKLSKWKDVTKP